MKSEINRLFKRWTLKNHPDHQGDPSLFQSVSDTKSILFKQIDWQEGKRWTLNLVKDGQQSRAHGASVLQGFCRHCILVRRISRRIEDEQAFKESVSRFIFSFHRRDFDLVKRCYIEFLTTSFRNLSDSICSMLSTEGFVISLVNISMESILSSIIEVTGKGRLTGGAFRHEGLFPDPESGLLRLYSVYQSLTNDVRDHDRKQDELRLEVQVLGSKYEALQTEHRKLQQSYEGLQNDHKTQKESLSKAQSDVARLKEMMPDDCRDGGSDFLSQIKNLFFQYKQSRSSASDWRTKYEMLEKENSANIRKVASLEEQLESKDAELKGLETQLRSNTEHFEGKLRVAETEFEKLTVQDEENRKLLVRMDDSLINFAKFKSEGIELKCRLSEVENLLSISTSRVEELENQLKCTTHVNEDGFKREEIKVSCRTGDEGFAIDLGKRVQTFQSSQLFDVSVEAESVLMDIFRAAMLAVWLDRIGALGACPEVIVQGIQGISEAEV